MRDHKKERAQARERAKELVEKMTLMEKAAQLRYDAAPVERLGVPAYNYWNEALHGVARAGVATMFPQAIAMAALFDEEEMKKIRASEYREGKADGKAEIVAIIRKKAGRGLDSEKIAEILEMDPDYVKRISDLLVEDPDRSDLQVAEILVGQKEPQ